MNTKLYRNAEERIRYQSMQTLPEPENHGRYSDDPYRSEIGTRSNRSQTLMQENEYTIEGS